MVKIKLESASDLSKAIGHRFNELKAMAPKEREDLDKKNDKLLRSLGFPVIARSSEAADGSE